MSALSPTPSPSLSLVSLVSSWKASAPSSVPSPSLSDDSEALFGDKSIISGVPSASLSVVISGNSDSKLGKNLISVVPLDGSIEKV